jgi:hypothetical protein
MECHEAMDLNPHERIEERNESNKAYVVTLIVVRFPESVDVTKPL